MSSIRESRLWAWLRNARMVFKSRLQLHRVENMVSSGDPDVQGMFDGASVMIELKCEDRPSCPTTKIKVRFEPSQPPWHEKHHKAGGYSYILIQVGSASKARRYLIRGKHIRSLAYGMREKDLERLSLCSPTARPAEIIETVRDAYLL